MIRHAPRVTDEALGRCNFLLLNISVETKDGLFEACSLFSDTALRVDFNLYIFRQLDGFRPSGQRNFLCAFRTKGRSVSLLYRISNDGAIYQVIVATSHRIVTLYGQVSSRQKAFEQSLEERPDWLTHVRRKAKHEIELTITFGVLSKSTYQSFAYFI